MLAQLMQNKNYQAAIEETHHTQKLDRPSGTAITLANDIISENKNYKKWSLQHEQNSLHINSIRKENVTGTHIVSWQNEIDKIEIKHEAFSRKGFAMGALLAAQWIIGKKGFFTMNDVLEI
jgi:4-hydroxy-tetrahydrodipicolinate reductase